jgi:WXG100 family type VII secretion target
VGQTIIVGADKLRATAQQLENLRNEAEGVLSNYLSSSHNIAGAGWQGDASMANLATTEEIHNAQMKLNTQWGELIHALQTAANTYEEQEEASRTAMQGVSQA